MVKPKFSFPPFCVRTKGASGVGFLGLFMKTSLKFMPGAISPVTGPHLFKKFSLLWRPVNPSHVYLATHVWIEISGLLTSQLTTKSMRKAAFPYLLLLL